MTLNPPTQYADDRNLRARQRMWEHQTPYFDLTGWVLDLAEIAPGRRVLDVGCGNGVYLAALRARHATAIGCDLSLGMLHAVRERHRVVNADAVALPLPDSSVDVVLAPHMLYHVQDRASAAREFRRVLRSGGVCVVVTNGAGHTRAVKNLVEVAVRSVTPGWEMRNNFSDAFSLENGAEQLRVAFDDVSCVRPEHVGPVVVTDASAVADYVASVADHYAHQVGRPWGEVVEEVRDAVARVIDAEGSFVVRSDVGAFVCR